jgi:hypothetical protein
VESKGRQKNGWTGLRGMLVDQHRLTDVEETFHQGDDGSGGTRKQERTEDCDAMQKVVRPSYITII